MTDRLQRARKDTLQTTPPTDKTNSTKQYSRHNRAWTRLTCAGTQCSSTPPRAEEPAHTHYSFHLISFSPTQHVHFMFSPTQPFVEYGPIVYSVTDNPLLRLDIILTSVHYHNKGNRFLKELSAITSCSYFVIQEDHLFGLKTLPTLHPATRCDLDFGANSG